MKTLTIGALARSAGVNVETIRYYERRSLIPRPERGDNGYRQYPGESVRRIRFIKRAQELGFTLAEIAELLELRSDPAESCGEVETRAERTIQRIDSKIEDLASMRAALGRLIKDCRRRRRSEDCPILATLEEEGHDQG